MKTAPKPPMRIPLLTFTALLAVACIALVASVSFGLLSCDASNTLITVTAVAQILSLSGLLTVALIEKKQDSKSVSEQVQVLEDKIAKLTDSLQIQHDAQRRIYELEESAITAHHAAHDIQNLIVSLTQKIKEITENDQLLPEQIQSATSALRIQLTQLEKLNIELLEVARTGQQRVPSSSLEQCSVDVLLELATAGLDTHRLQVDIDIDIAIDGSYTELARALRNVITNALCVAVSPVRISAQSITLSQSKSFFLGSIPQGLYCELSVEDDGPGISDQEKRNIFQPYYSTKGVHGTGLGLVIVAKTVRDHKGAIDISSSANGTRFSLYLPAEKSQRCESHHLLFESNPERAEKLLAESDGRSSFFTLVTSKHELLQELENEVPVVVVCDASRNSQLIRGFLLPLLSLRPNIRLIGLASDEEFKEIERLGSSSQFRFLSAASHTWSDVLALLS